MVHAARREFIGKAARLGLALAVQPFSALARAGQSLDDAVQEIDTGNLAGVPAWPEIRQQYLDDLLIQGNYSHIRQIIYDPLRLLTSKNFTTGRANNAVAFCEKRSFFGSGGSFDVYVDSGFFRESRAVQDATLVHENQHAADYACGMPTNGNRLNLNRMHSEKLFHALLELRAAHTELKYILGRREDYESNYIEKRRDNYKRIIGSIKHEFLHGFLRPYEKEIALRNLELYAPPK